MSMISDKIAALSKSVDDEVVRSQQKTQTFKDQVTQLTAQNPTQADLDAIDAAKVKIDALDVTSPVVLPAPVESAPIPA